MMKNLISGTVLCLLILMISAVVAVMPVSALPGDTDGDLIVSEQELSDAVIPYMKVTFLNEADDALESEELSLAAHNCLHLPYGRIVMPVSKDTDILPVPNALNVRASPQTLLYEGLVTRFRNGDFHGWLAEDGEWEVSDDGRTWTIPLVENALWHDGEPFTSEDVKFTFEYMTDNSLEMGSVFSDVESVDCPDEYTAVFNLKSCQPLFLDRLNGGPGIAVFPKHIWENCADPAHEQDEAYIGTGPFRYLNDEPGMSLIEASSDYHGDLPFVKQVVKVFMSDEGEQINALINGEIDLMDTGFGISPSGAEALKGQENIRVFSISENGNVYEVTFNSGKYPANITGFRKALSHAVNRDAMATLIGQGYAHPTRTAYLLPYEAPYINPETNNRFAYDIDLAKSILRDAGFTLDAEGGKPVLKDPAGNPVVLSAVYGGKAHRGGADEKIVQVLKTDWTDRLGITLETEEVNDKKMYKAAIDNTHIHFDGMPVRFHNDIDDLDNFQYSPLKHDYYHWHNETFDSLIDQLDSTANKAERKRIGDELQEILVQDVPMIPVCSMDSIHAYRSDRFAGLEEALRNGGGDIYTFTHIWPVSVDVAVPEES